MSRGPGLPDHYATLGVSPRASGEEIREAYLALVARYHPDKHQGNDLEELARQKMIEINAAYEQLGDPDRRAAYDRDRAGRPDAGPPAPPRTVDSRTLVRSVLLTVAILLSLPLVLRFLRGPRALILLGVGGLVAYGVFRLVRRFGKK